MLRGQKTVVNAAALASQREVICSRAAARARSSLLDLVYRLGRGEMERAWLAAGRVDQALVTAARALGTAVQAEGRADRLADDRTRSFAQEARRELMKTMAHVEDIRRTKQLVRARLRAAGLNSREKSSGC